MPRYIITKAAGRKIGGQPNTGVGTELELSEGFADAFVAMGWVIPVPVEGGDGGQIDANPENLAEKQAQDVSEGKGGGKRKRASAGENSGA